MTGTSAARIRANRLNAQRSTGPKTAEGKARVRINAAKHGLTGAGIALPTEDAAVVERRFAQLHEELAPATLEAALLVRQAALMSVRMERAARHETAALALSIRHAAAEFDLTTLAEVDHHFDTIEEAPRANHRRLLATPEGVDRLAEALGAVRSQVASGVYREWTDTEWLKVAAFFGSDGVQFPVSRPAALLNALRGDWNYIAPGEFAGIPDDAARTTWARRALIALVDAERARLASVRAGFDPAIREVDRRDAAARAQFDPSPAATLARRYEAASTRAFVRALRDFHALNDLGAVDAVIPDLEDATDPAVGVPTEPDAPVAVAGEPELAAKANPDLPNKANAAAIADSPEPWLPPKRIADGSAERPGPGMGGLAAPERDLPSPHGSPGSIRRAS